MKTKRCFAAGSAFAMIAMLCFSAWAVPQLINYQGYVEGSKGPLSGSYNMEFSLWSPFVFLPLWEEVQQVEVTEGIFNVHLGSQTALSEELFRKNESLYLELKIENPQTGTWETLTPRQQLTSEAFAMHAANADTLDGKEAEDLDQSGHVTDTNNPHQVTAAQVGALSISEFTWENLAGIPAGFDDDVDDTGILEETDPTVPAYVKDGVDWTEISGIPAGFVDGIDNDSGDITGVYAGDGLTGGGPADEVTLSVAVPLELTHVLPGPAIKGANTGPGSGVLGLHQGSGNYGYLGASASGVYGETDMGRGVHGKAINNGDVTNYGGYFEAGGRYGAAVYGEASHSYGGRGVYGKAVGDAGIGVYGETSGPINSAIFGKCTSDPYGKGVMGTAVGAEGQGVYGEASNTNDVVNYGGYFVANGQQGRGAYCAATHDGDVENYGGYFISQGQEGRGIYAEAANTSGTNYGGYFVAQGSYGYGVYGSAEGENDQETYGGYFVSRSGPGRGVYGEATNDGDYKNYGGYFVGAGKEGYGVYAESTGLGGAGVRGNAYGGFGTGVMGFSDGHHGTAVYGYAFNSDDVKNYGGFFRSLGDQGIGVFAEVIGPEAIAIYAEAVGSSTKAGFFNGDVEVNGTLTKSGGSFKIDHPLDPENKYLNHSFVESPDMMNMYNGNIVLNNDGEAWVELPEWFEALNKDFRYQLTPVGAPGPNLYIAQTITDNRFKIAGGEPEMEVSWQVTGIRQDPWANDNRIPVEEDKTDKEIGYYLHPESYGRPEEKSIEWARDPEGRQRMKEEREKLYESTS